MDQGITDEEALELVDDLIPGPELFRAAEDVFDDRADPLKVGTVTGVEDGVRFDPALQKESLPVAVEQVFHALVLLARPLNQANDQRGSKVVEVLLDKPLAHGAKVVLDPVAVERNT